MYRTFYFPVAIIDVLWMTCVADWNVIERDEQDSIGSVSSVHKNDVTIQIEREATSLALLADVTLGGG